MIAVLAFISIKEGKREEFLSIFKANVPKVLAEDGCIEYMPTIDHPTDIAIQEQDAKVVTILEKWQSLEHLKAHLAAPHMLEYQAAVKDMVEGVSIKVLQEA